MPLPSVEPMPLVPAELRFSLPLEAQEASYLAASASTASLRLRVSVAIFFVHPLFWMFNGLGCGREWEKGAVEEL